MNPGCGLLALEKFVLPWCLLVLTAGDKEHDWEGTDNFLRQELSR